MPNNQRLPLKVGRHLKRATRNFGSFTISMVQCLLNLQLSLITNTVHAIPLHPKEKQRSCRAMYRINSGIMNNFICDPNILFWELFFCFVSNLNSPLNTPAKTIRFCKFYSYVSPCIVIVVFLQSLYYVTCKSTMKTIILKC